MRSPLESDPDEGTSTLDDVRASGALRTPTVAEIFLDRLRRNAAVFRTIHTGAELMAVVKADAYGHGASRVARELAEEGVDWFAVATAAEGMKLRRAGIEGRIMVFASPLPEYLNAYAQYDLDATVSSSAVADAVIDEAASGSSLRVHLKVDTGMGRIGVSPDEAPHVMARLERAPNVHVTGLWTHLATADEPDPSFAYQQLERFDAVVAEIGDAAEYIHTANSAAALRIDESVRYKRALIRAGIGLYGYTALEGLAANHGLEPVMKLSSRVTLVKSVEPGATISYGRRWTADQSTRIATVGAGYADGYRRLLTNRGKVGIHKNQYAVVGTVCMDMFMVDVERDAISEGDEVVLFGDGGPDAFEVAGWAETIPYEVLTSVTARVPRIYHAHS